jgi:hypothetical protein
MHDVWSILDFDAYAHRTPRYSPLGLSGRHVEDMLRMGAAVAERRLAEEPARGAEQLRER